MPPSPSTSRPNTPSAPILRPKSSPSLHQPHRQPHPYMVALSGWPSPIYIPLPSSSHPSTSSRSNTPYHDLERNQIREGISSGPISMKRSKSSSKSPHSHSHSHNHQYSHPHVLAQTLTPKTASIPVESLLSKECPYTIFGMECTIPGHPKHINGGEEEQLDKSDVHERDIIGAEIGTGMRMEGIEDGFRYGMDDDDGLSPFPTSSTRGTPHPTPPSSPKLHPHQPQSHSQPQSQPHSQPQSQPQSHLHTPPQPQPQPQPQSQSKTQNKQVSSRKKSLGMLPPPIPNKPSTQLDGTSAHARSSLRNRGSYLSVLSDRSLKLTPSWSMGAEGSRSHLGDGGPGQGGGVDNLGLVGSRGGERGEGGVTGPGERGGVVVGGGFRGMRSVPEVWPRPGCERIGTGYRIGSRKMYPSEDDGGDTILRDDGKPQAEEDTTMEVMNGL